MKFVSLVWKNVWRRKMRTIFTLLSIFVAFLLFGILMTIRMAFTFGVEIAGLDRLVLIHKVSLIMPLPVSYQSRLQGVPGVERATHQTWFGGVYQDPSNFFAQMAVEPESFLAIYPEFKVPPEQIKAWLGDRQGALVGRDLAARFGWKIGDRIPIQATIWQPKQGQTWEFNVAGIYDGEAGIDKTQFFFRYDYLDENRSGGAGLVGWYVVKIDDPDKSSAVSSAIDQQFANTPFETKTTTEQQFAASFASMFGNLNLLIGSIALAVVITTLFVAANTMAMSVRERTTEIAVMRTLGFPSQTIFLFIAGEAVIIALLGGLVGAGLARLIVNGETLGMVGGFIPNFGVNTANAALGLGISAFIGVVAGIIPATMATIALTIFASVPRGPDARFPALKS